MKDMDASNRRRLINELLRLPRRELDDVLDAVDAHERTEEAGIDALRAAFEQRVDSPFSPLARVLTPTTEEEQTE
jgi:hypothetical protein